ncbi:jg3629 [Pararge aegeria aegeria]|uniref:Jg3629 protein n=1 Tax=Pararge aegeria aegeria TaxID=348720 RepID=A0A8S4RAZ7_9NEOP|nr:jg3629 [Pararge aegeria aegeria]
MPDRTVGRIYADFMKDNNITADSRLQVQFIEDPDLAYVMQRYREVHDLVHATLFMKTTMLGEVTVKWVEGIQTKLPMCIGGGIWGAARLKPKHRQLYLKYYLPWAIKTGNNAKFLQAIYFEKRWDQNIDDFHREMNIVPLTKA